jgi:hypothetical protein
VVRAKQRLLHARSGGHNFSFSTFSFSTKVAKAATVDR